MKISISDMVNAYSAAKHKDWGGHDRDDTIGASEVGQCARKIWFRKHGIAPDADYHDSAGARDRGDLIEQHWWVPAIQGHKPASVRFLYAGEEQRTLVDGYLSATPDGLLVGVSKDCLFEEHGIEDVTKEPTDD